MHLIAAGEKIILPGAGQKEQIVVEAGTIQGEIELNSLFFHKEYSADHHYLHFSFEGSVPGGRPGQSEIPVFSRLVEMVDGGGYLLKIESLDSVIIPLDTKYPGMFPALVKESAIKSPGQFRWVSEPYVQETPRPNLPLVELEKQGVVRGLHIGRLIVRPVQYSAENNTLTVYFRMNFSLQPVDAGAGPDFSSELPMPFKSALRMVTFDNLRSVKKKVVSDSPITMVILSDSLFSESLAPLVAWKKRKGFNVIEAYTSDPAVGNTSAAIKSYLAELYFDPPEGVSPPSYLLIAGDVEHVPLSQTPGQITDLYYTTFDGEGDYLPEYFHGRVSVKDTAELNSVVNKILMYEQYRFPDPSYLDHTILIAGYDAAYAPVHGNGQINYAHEYYFNEAKGNLAHVYLHPEAASSDLEILQKISEGASFVNYTGHGEYYGWLDPVFQLRHIDTMQNLHKYSFMIGNGCSTNQFNMVSQDCFAEKVVKVKDRGAIGYIGCTNDSYWDEDFYWAVGLGNITATPDSVHTTYGYYDKVFLRSVNQLDAWAPTMGEMIYAGNMTVQESNSGRKKYYWEIYQLMGDPTLAPWFRRPAEVPAFFPENIPADARRFTLETAPFDYIAVSADGLLVTAMNADSRGYAYITLPDTLGSRDLEIVITGDDRIPVMDTIYRTNDSGPYLELSGISVVQENVAEDHKISPGEGFSLQLELYNSGNQESGSVDLVLRSLTQEGAVSDSILQLDNLAPGMTSEELSGFRLMFPVDVKDREVLKFLVTATTPYGSQVFTFSLQAYAPELVSRGIVWDDRPQGNGNGIIEAGEIISFEWKVLNQGSYVSDTLKLTEYAVDWDPVGSDGEFFPPLEPDRAGLLRFNASLPGQKQQNILATSHYQVVAGGYMIEDSLKVFSGRYFEDFSDEKPRFRFQYNNQPWEPDTLQYSGGPASMRSAKIGHSEVSSVLLEIFLPGDDSISFDYRVSSEKNYDFLSLFIDSVLIDRWSGNVGWNRFSFPVDSGPHLLEWRYIKDQNTIGGEDAAWIDNIALPEGAFKRADMSLVRMLSPASGGFLSASEEVKILLMNHGLDRVKSVLLRFKVNDGAIYEETFEGQILPDSSLEYTFDQPVDMQTPGIYMLQFGMSAENDLYPGNDSLVSTAVHYSFPDLSLEYAGMDSITSEYVNLLLRIINSGNLENDSVYYSIYRDGLFLRSESRAANLLPGEDTTVSVSLVSAADSLRDGLYTFNIVAAPDSVEENNLLEIPVLWTAFGTKISGKTGVAVYPNPVSDQFLLELPENVSLPVKAEFMGTDGRVVYETAIVNHVTDFYTSEIFPGEGIYIIRLTGGTGQSSMKPLNSVILLK